MTAETKLWSLEGYDTFDYESYPLPGTYPTLEAAESAARERLKYLEQTQPTSSSGGQYGGIQDRVYIVSPDGKRTRFL